MAKSVNDIKSMRIEISENSFEGMSSVKYRVIINTTGNGFSNTEQLRNMSVVKFLQNKEKKLLRVVCGKCGFIVNDTIHNSKYLTELKKIQKYDELNAIYFPLETSLNIDVINV